MLEIINVPAALPAVKQTFDLVSQSRWRGVFASRWLKTKTAIPTSANANSHLARGYRTTAVSGPRMASAHPSLREVDRDQRAAHGGDLAPSFGHEAEIGDHGRRSRRKRSLVVTIAPCHRGIATRLHATASRWRAANSCPPWAQGTLRMLSSEDSTPTTSASRTPQHRYRWRNNRRISASPTIRSRHTGKARKAFKRAFREAWKIRFVANLTG